jgi:hypothetical protein
MIRFAGGSVIRRAGIGDKFGVLSARKFGVLSARISGAVY